MVDQLEFKKACWTLFCKNVRGICLQPMIFVNVNPVGIAMGY